MAAQVLNERGSPRRQTAQRRVRAVRRVFGVYYDVEIKKGFQVFIVRGW
jgi:hypothetical protein